MRAPLLTARIHMHLQTHMHIHTCVHMRECQCFHTHKHKHTYTNTCNSKHTYIYLHLHLHVHSMGSTWRHDVSFIGILRHAGPAAWRDDADLAVGKWQVCVFCVVDIEFLIATKSAGGPKRAPTRQAFSTKESVGPAGRTLECELGRRRKRAGALQAEFVWRWASRPAHARARGRARSRVRAEQLRGHGRRTGSREGHHFVAHSARRPWVVVPSSRHIATACVVTVGVRCASWSAPIAAAWRMGGGAFSVAPSRK